MTGDMMRQRFSESATRVIYFAQVEAQKRGVSVVGTEHLLVGLAREGEGLAVRVLAQLEVSLDKVREEYARQPFATTPAYSAPQRLTLSPIAKQVLANAVEESRMLHAYHGQPDAIVDTEHVLLGLLRASDDAHSSMLFKGMQVDLDVAYREVMRHLGAPATPRRRSLTALIASQEGLHRLMFSKWVNTFGLLVISLLLFIVSAQVLPFRNLGLIIGIILVHELGHLVAMHLFGYKNLRMFFIPFLGAAVSGSSFNMPGWKKAVVSLAGPGPGMLIGIALVFIGVKAHNPFLLKAAYLFVLVNGFNLLPIIPLDGGWFLHTLVCTRHPYLELAFRVCALAGIAGLVILLHSYLVLLLCVPVLISLPSCWHIAAVAHRLQKLGMSGSSPDAVSIPPAMAEIIRSELRARMPKVTNLATHLVKVFETLNTRAPGWAASLLLLAIYLTMLVTAVLAFFAYAVWRHYGPFAVELLLPRLLTVEIVCGGALVVTGVLAALFARRQPLTEDGVPVTVISTPDVPPDAGDDNAIDTFRVAGELLVDREKILAVKVVPGESPVAHLEERMVLVRQNAAVLAKVREGFAVTYRYPEITDLTVILPLFDVIQPMMHLFPIEAQVKAVQGDTAGAVQSCVDGMRLGIIMPRGGVLITHLVGTVAERFCRNGLRPFVAHLNVDQVRQTLTALETLERLRTPFAEVVEEEGALCLRMMEQLIDDPETFMQGICENAKEREIYARLASLPLRAERAPLKEATLRFIDVARAHLALPYTPDAQWWQEATDELSREMLALLADALQKSHLREAETSLQAAFTMLHLAVHGYELTHGGRPACLDELVPEFLSSVPRDPFTADSPIGYLWDGQTCTIFSNVPEGLDAQKYRLVIRTG